MFTDWKIAGTPGRFLLLATVVSGIVGPFYASARRAQTKCARCGSVWTKKESGRETIRRYRRRKADEFESEDYWQIWTCEACGDVTRRRQSEYNPDGHLVGD
jgi:uncharacterized C2H2 Zn-finger protein